MIHGASLLVEAGSARGLSWSFNLSRLDSNGAVINDDYRNQSAFLTLGLHQSNRQVDFHFFGNADDVGDPGPYGSDPNGTFGASLQTIGSSRICLAISLVIANSCRYVCAKLQP